MRDLLADKALCEKYVTILNENGFVTPLGARELLSGLAQDALPEAIDRAIAAEAEVERLQAALLVAGTDLCAQCNSAYACKDGPCDAKRAILCALLSPVGDHQEERV